MQVLSQAKAKQLKLLHQKKHRDLEFCFLVEGAKAVAETLQSNWEVVLVAGTEKFVKSYTALITKYSERFYLLNEDQLSQVSTFQNNDSALCVVRQKEPKAVADPKADIWLAVEEIRDPGNLGTIIRLADWFGLSQLICLGDCVEWFSPKVISSSMGSFLRVQPIEISPKLVVNQKDRPLFSAHMEGQSLYEFSFPEKCTLVIGNEARGISDFLLRNSSAISIPRFGPAESLNAAMATGIMLNQWRFGLQGK